MKFESYIYSLLFDILIIDKTASKIVYSTGSLTITILLRSGIRYCILLSTISNYLKIIQRGSEIIVAGPIFKIQRLSLIKGSITEPLITALINIKDISFSKKKGLLFCACDNGLLECFDLRVCCSITRRYLHNLFKSKNGKLSAIRSNNDELNLVVGTFSGLFIVLDLRSNYSISIKDYKNYEKIFYVNFINLQIFFLSI